MQRELAYQHYRRTQIQTADPGDLLLMLYQGAIKFSKLGMEAMQEKDVEKTHKNLMRTQEIVLELSLNLNHEAGEIAQNLEMLYEYILQLIVEADLKKESEPLQQVIEMLSELYETWSEVVLQQKRRGRPNA